MKILHAYSKCKTFIEFIEFIEPNPVNWKLGRCSCPFYLKNYICKHVIAVSATLRLDGCIIPLTAKQIPLGQKRKRGAPKKAAQALIRQLNNIFS